MSKELIVNSSVHETRLAILEDDRLVELYIEQESQHALAGSIFKGRVTRVLPGMQSAFVDIGLERDAFLYVSDFLDENEDLETAPADATPRRSEGSSEDEPAEPNAKADSTDRLANAGADTQSAAPEEKAPTDGNLARRGGRGRRPRRRRGRSGEGSAAGSESGFPEEKYAPIDGDEQPKDTEPAAVVDPPVKQESDFIVLPGESLAKYSGPTTSEEPTPDDDAPRIARARDENVEASVERDGVPADDTDSDVDAAVEETNSSPEGPAGEGLDLSSEDIAAEELPEPVTPVEIVVVEDDGEAFLASERSPELHNEVVVDRRTNTVPTGETGEPATVTEDAAGEGVENEAEEAPQEPGGSEEQPAGEPESGEEVAAGAAEAPAAGSEDAGPTDEGPRVPGRPLPADEENDERQAAPEPGEDSGRPQEGEVRHRTRSTSASFERRRGRRGRRRGRRREGPATEPAEDHSEAGDRRDNGPKISDLLARGQEVLVQISKEPLGKKGARITSHIALPGRFLVYMPTVNHTGVSRKIASDKERARLRKIVHAHNTGMPGGFIVRTAGDGVTEEDLRGDMLFLYNLWLDIREKSERYPSASLVHHDDDVVERVLRDRLGEDFKTIWVDSEEQYELVLRFVERFQPDLLRAVKLYTRTKPIFDSFKISTEIEKALRPKVWLKSGGYIVINPTEALVSIDVNTGKYVGKSDRLEDTIVNTNLEAVNEIVRQLRVRDLGGIIVVDFIDMEERANRQKVMAALEKELRIDIAPSKALPFNEFGLVAITRKRVKQSLERSLCTPCPYCHGASYVKSAQSVIYEILTDAKKRAVSKDPKKDLTLRVNPEVARKLKSRDNNYLKELEQILRANVLVRGDVSLHRDHFDIH